MYSDALPSYRLRFLHIYPCGKPEETHTHMKKKKIKITKIHFFFLFCCRNRIDRKSSNWIIEKQRKKREEKMKIDQRVLPGKRGEARGRRSICRWKLSRVRWVLDRPGAWQGVGDVRLHSSRTLSQRHQSILLCFLPLHSSSPFPLLNPDDFGRWDEVGLGEKRTRAKGVACLGLKLNISGCIPISYWAWAWVGN